MKRKLSTITIAASLLLAIISPSEAMYYHGIFYELIYVSMSIVRHPFPVSHGNVSIKSFRGSAEVSQDLEEGMCKQDASGGADQIGAQIDNCGGSVVNCDGRYTIKIPFEASAEFTVNEDEGRGVITLAVDPDPGLYMPRGRIEAKASVHLSPDCESLEVGIYGVDSSEEFKVGMGLIYRTIEDEEMLERKCACNQRN